MTTGKTIAAAVLLAGFGGCAARPAYFGSGARVIHENGAAYWEAPVLAPAYLQVRMLRPRRAAVAQPALYEGMLTLRSISPRDLRAAFTLPEGSSATFHFDLNPAEPAAAVRYAPAALDVVVACARGACRAASKSAPIFQDGTIPLKARRRPRPARRAAARRAADAGALAAAAALRKDGECAALDDALASARTRMARTGEAETRTEGEARGRFIAQGCAAWLDAHGGVGAARRRVRLSQWTSLRGD